MNSSNKTGENGDSHWGEFQSRNERLGDFPAGRLHDSSGEPIFTEVPQKIAALNRGVGGRLSDFTTRIE